MADLKFLILLFYYNRPQIARGAIESVFEQTYKRPIDLVMIDDSDDWRPGFELYETYSHACPEHIDFIYQHTGDIKEQKLARGGSMFGEFANQAMLKSDADVAIMLNDDDFLDSQYLEKLNNFFNMNPHIKYAYSDVILYNPLEEKYEDVKQRKEVDHSMFLNSNKAPHMLMNSKDSSQTAWRLECIKQGGVRFPAPQTRALDATFYAHLFHVYGPGVYTGFLGQYKGWHRLQLGSRGTDYENTE